MSADENKKNHDDGEDTSSSDHDCDGADGRRPPELHEEVGKMFEELESKLQDLSEGNAELKNKLGLS